MKEEEEDEEEEKNDDDEGERVPGATGESKERWKGGRPIVPGRKTAESSACSARSSLSFRGAAKL